MSKTRAKNDQLNKASSTVEDEIKQVELE